MMWIIWIGVAGLVYYLLKENGLIGGTRQMPLNNVVNEETALEVLRMRFVKGEIDEATYLKMKSLIE